MLRKLVSAFIGALLGVVVSLYPVVVGAQQQLRVDSVQDVVEVSRQVVGAESLTAPPVNDGYGLWPAATTLGLGLFGGWLVWGRRHEPEVIVHQFDSGLVDPDEQEDLLKPEGSLFGLNMVEFTLKPPVESVAPAPPTLKVEPVVESVAEPLEIVWGEYPAPVQHCFPSMPATVFEDPEPVYHCHPEFQPNQPAAVELVSEEVLEALPAHEDPINWVVLEQPEVEDLESVPNCPGVELVDIDGSTDDPWHFGADSTDEYAHEPVLVRR